jgi:hypothetical protein
MAEGKSKRRNKVNIHTVEKAGDSTLNPVNLLEEITRKYAAVNEEDFDIKGIYKHRENRNERKNVNGV